MLSPNLWIVVKFLQAYFYGFRGTVAEKHCLSLLSWWWCKWWRIWCSKFPRNSNACYLRSLTRTPQTCVAPFRHCDTHRTRENCQIIFSKSSVLLLLLLFIVLLVMCSKSRPPPSEVTLKATFPNLIFNCEISLPFYVYASVHRWSILIIVQRDATQSSLFIILQVRSARFGCQPHPSSGVHKTVTTASGTGHIFCAATFFQRGQAWPRWREVAAQYRRLYLQFCVLLMMGLVDTRNM